MALKQTTCRIRSAGTPRRTRSGRTRTDVLWVAADVLMVGGVAGGLWWHWWVGQNAVSEIAFPAPPPPPAVNGYDVMVTAAGAIVDKDAINYAHYMYVPDAGRPAVTPAACAAAARDNAASLVEIHRALTLPWQSPAGLAEDGFGRYPENEPLVSIRRAARLLRIEADVQREQGNSSEAAQDDLDAMELGADLLPHGGGLATSLTGLNCELAGRHPLLSQANSLSAADARAAALRVERINDQRVVIADVLTVEESAGSAALRDRLRSSSLLHLADEVEQDPNVSQGSDRTAEQRLITREQVLMTGKSDVLRNYAAYMDALIARVRRPYTAAAPFPVAAGLVTRTFISGQNAGFSMAVFRAVEAQADDAELSAVLALHAYRADHGDYPASLTALVAGGYLTHLPVDPFDPSEGPLRYRLRTSNRYLLYSVGPDGKDDGGLPIAIPGGESKPMPWVEPGQTGDIVVGANLFDPAAPAGTTGGPPLTAPVRDAR